MINKNRFNQKPRHRILCRGSPITKFKNSEPKFLKEMKISLTISENKISRVHNFNFIHNQKRNIDKFKQTRPHSRSGEMIYPGRSMQPELDSSGRIDQHTEISIFIYHAPMAHYK
jgi:hypothetical protein